MLVLAVVAFGGIVVESEVKCLKRKQQNASSRFRFRWTNKLFQMLRLCLTTPLLSTRCGRYLFLSVETLDPASQEIVKNDGF